MNLKKMISYLKGKGIEPTADELSDFIEEPKMIKTNEPNPLPDYSQLQHNVKAIQELKETFEKQLNSKDETIKELTTKIDSFMAESLKDKEERAVREKAYQDEQDKIKSDLLAKERKAILDKAIEEGRIAPKNEALLKVLENKDIEELKTVVESFPASTKPESSQNSNGQNTNGQKFNLSTAQDLYSYVSDITVN